MSKTAVRTPIVAPGEKLHVISRQLFERDVRRHFVGEVMVAADALVRLQGYVFVYEPGRQHYVRRPEPRTRILGLGDGTQIVKLLPHDVAIEKLSYVLGPDGSLVLTDGRGFQMDIHEFLPA